MRRTPGRLSSLTRKVVALTSTRGLGIGESRAYLLSIGGEDGEYVWVASGGVEPLSRFFPAGLASLLSSSIKSISLVWVMNSLREEKPSISARKFL